MRIQSIQAMHCGQAFTFVSPVTSSFPGEIIDRAAGVVTNNGKTTVHKQLLEAAVLIAFVAELAGVFLVLGR